MQQTRNYYSKTLLVVTSVVFLVAGGCSSQQQLHKITPPQTSTLESLQTTLVTIHNFNLQVEVAENSEEQTRGLSSRASLPQNSGMLFPFSPPSTPKFWMRGMLFPIDIIWIRDGRVIGTMTNLPPQKSNQPNEDLPTYTPPGNIDYALEVNAAFVSEHAIKENDPVKIKTTTLFR